MEFQAELEQAVRDVEQVIELYLPEQEGYQKTVLEAMNYSMRAGGKRLRPLLMRETCRLFGKREKAVEPFMAAIEMIHTASLIHDDLPCMDNDEMRRGLPTAWVKYGYDMAVLAGDGLLIYAVETAAKALDHTDRPDLVAKCIGILARKTGIYGMIGGQTVDVEYTERSIPKEQLDFIYRLKTGALLEAAMVIGAWIGGADESQAAVVEQMASYIGFAFQIQDDILDVTGSPQVLGKPVLSDEKNHKTTYVTLQGIERAREEVSRVFGQASDCLNRLPGDHVFLEALIEQLIHRKF